MRALPWIVTVAAVAGLIASASEISRLKTRIGEISRHHFQDHAGVRQFVIRSALTDIDQPIVVLGDSVAEMAPLPQMLCGRPVVNAGVGGMPIEEAAAMLGRVLDGKRPYLVVLALGANNIGSKTSGRDFAELLKSTAKVSPRVVSIAVTSDATIDREISAAAASAEVPYINPQIDPALKMDDHTHYTGAAYRIWLPALEAAVNAQCG